MAKKKAAAKPAKKGTPKKTAAASYPSALQKFLKKDGEYAQEAMGQSPDVDAQYPPALEQLLGGAAAKDEQKNPPAQPYPAALANALGLKGPTATTEAKSAPKRGKKPTALQQLLDAAEMQERMDAEAPAKASPKARSSPKPKAPAKKAAKKAATRTAKKAAPRKPSAAQYPPALQKLLEATAAVSLSAAASRGRVAQMPPALRAHLLVGGVSGMQRTSKPKRAAPMPPALRAYLLVGGASSMRPAKPPTAALPAALVQLLEGSSGAGVSSRSSKAPKAPKAKAKPKATAKAKAPAAQRAKKGAARQTRPAVAQMPQVLQSYLTSAAGPVVEGTRAVQYPAALSRLLENLDDAVSVSAGVLEAKMPAALLSYLGQDTVAKAKMDEVVVKYPAALSRLLESLDDEVAGLDAPSMAAMPSALLRYLDGGAGAQAVGSAQYPAALARLLENLDDEVSGSVLEAKIPAALLSYLGQDSAAKEQMD
eukprot:1891527-Rhodomonas_salina.1